MAPYASHEPDAQTVARRATWIGVAANVFLSAIKLAGGILGRSAALVADGFHSLSDVLSSLIILVGLHIAAQPADDEHPYGHGKAEAIAGKLVSLLLMALAVTMAWNSISSLRGEPPAPPAPFALGIIIVSIAVKEGLFQYKIRLATRIGSTALMADAWHHRSDAVSSVVALAGVALTLLGGPAWHVMDHVAALGIAVIIFWVGVKVFREASSELLDGVIHGPKVKAIVASARAVDGVSGTEKVFVRKSGLDQYVDIHVEVDPDMSVREAHRIASRVRDRVCADHDAVKGVMVHIEPSPEDSGSDQVDETACCPRSGDESSPA